MNNIITQQSISTFLELQDVIKAEALRINNMLNDENHEYVNQWCGVFNQSSLEMSINDKYITLSYSPSYEDYTDTWTIPTKYIGLSDEEILAIAHEEWDNLVQAQREREITCLKRQADMFGYELKEKI
jgi:hypothetical protein